ncbi:hypothetical protein OH492_22850 [Vibrio chagasii]|nr:hypothetical protein [Vibrio chagasii]
MVESAPEKKKITKSTVIFLQLSPGILRKSQKPDVESKSFGLQMTKIDEKTLQL